MPPCERVERTGQGSEYIRYFRVLLDDPRPFDPEEFKRLSRDVTGSWTLPIHLKFIVKGSRMVVFSEVFSHLDTDNQLDREGEDGQLLSAGMIELHADTGREIFGRSISLENRLRISDSDNYKKTVLKEKIGEFFQIG